MIEYNQKQSKEIYKAAVLAEQMFAGEIRRDSLSGQVSNFAQESRTREKLDKLILKNI